MLVKKTKEGTVSDSDGATGAHRLVGARPVEHGCGSYFGSVGERSNRSIGVNGACPLGLPPPLGERGVTLAIFTQAKKKLGGDFSRAEKIENIHFDAGLSLLPFVFLTRTNNLNDHAERL
jgi:hypothetical protein